MVMGGMGGFFSSKTLKNFWQIFLERGMKIHQITDPIEKNALLHKILKTL